MTNLLFPFSKCLFSLKQLALLILLYCSLYLSLLKVSHTVVGFHLFTIIVNNLLELLSLLSYVLHCVVF